MPRKCNTCGSIWYSQSPKCIYCDSEDIIWDYVEKKGDEDGKKN